MKETSEFLITLFSSFAQAESESISQKRPAGSPYGHEAGQGELPVRKAPGL